MSRCVGFRRAGVWGGHEQRARGCRRQGSQTRRGQGADDVTLHRASVASRGGVAGDDAGDLGTATNLFADVGPAVSSDSSILTFCERSFALGGGELLRSSVTQRAMSTLLRSAFLSSMSRAACILLVARFIPLLRPATVPGSSELLGTGVREGCLEGHPVFPKTALCSCLGLLQLLHPDQMAGAFGEGTTSAKRTTRYVFWCE